MMEIGRRKKDIWYICIILSIMIHMYTCLYSPCMYFCAFLPSRENAMASCLLHAFYNFLYITDMCVSLKMSVLPVVSQKGRRSDLWGRKEEGGRRKCLWEKEEGNIHVMYLYYIHPFTYLLPFLPLYIHAWWILEMSIHSMLCQWEIMPNSYLQIHY